MNERAREVRSPDEERIEFLCECGDQQCTGVVRLTAAEYEELRADPTTFAVLPGHMVADIDKVVVKTERFHIVRKRPGEQDVARLTNPRSSS